MLLESDLTTKSLFHLWHQPASISLSYIVSAVCDASKKQPFNKTHSTPCYRPPSVGVPEHCKSLQPLMNIAWEGSLTFLAKRMGRAKSGLILEPHSLSLIHGTEPFLRSCQLCSYSRTSQHFMEPEGSVLSSQEPSTGPYPEIDQSNPYNPVLSLQDPF
jgi:hypothetical protein